METHIKAFYQTPMGVKFVTLFAYSTNGVPGLEINGVGKLSKNIKEKLIYLTRVRRLHTPLKRIVLTADSHELLLERPADLKWLEFPFLLLYWYLCGVLPIKGLNDCLSSGWLKTTGEVFHLKLPHDFREQYAPEFNPVERKGLKLIGPSSDILEELYIIDSSLLLEHIKDMSFRIDDNNLLTQKSGEVIHMSS